MSGLGGKGLAERHFVLRSYDNRVRQTSRSPFLYENWRKLREQMTTIVNIVDEGRGDEEIMRFRDAKYYEQYTLFRDDGVRCQVKVIAVPFIEGEHHCTRISQALSITKELEELHRAGFVHGDIRALNIVFQKNGDAEFIDFDFGGKEGIVNYPPGYVDILDDGIRKFKWDMGQKMEDIQIIQQHDVEALCHVLGVLHRLPMEASDKQIRARNDLQEADSLKEMRECLEKMKGGKHDVNLLPSKNFQIYLDEYNERKGKQKTMEGETVTPDRITKTQR